MSFIKGFEIQARMLLQAIRLYLAEADFEQLFHLQGVLIFFGETRSFRWERSEVYDLQDLGSTLGF